MPIPKVVAGFNKNVTNRLILLFAGKLQPFAVVHHKGRRSGNSYKTPILAFKKEEVIIIALTYGRSVDWLKNLLAAGSGEIELGGSKIHVSVFHILPYTGYEGFSSWVHLFLNLISVTECLHMNKLK